MTTRHEDAALRITGRVQGVGFRYWASSEAQALGLRGWVRNEPGGAVLARFIGDKAAVEAMLKRCEAGPRHARVTGVERITPPDAPEHADVKGFTILR